MHEYKEFQDRVDRVQTHIKAEDVNLDLIIRNQLVSKNFVEYEFDVHYCTVLDAFEGQVYGKILAAGRWIGVAYNKETGVWLTVD